MATVEQQARRDLRSKIKLEKELARDIKAFNNRLIRNTVAAAGMGLALSPASFNAELSSMLSRHYKKTGEEFDHTLTDQLPADIEITPAEAALITASLAAFYTARAPVQTDIIMATNNRDITRAIRLAEISATEEGLTVAETARATGANLRRSLNGRVGAISAFETQAVAEKAKNTEALVLTTGQVEDISREVPVTKQWVTQGDERVRLEHIVADSQEVDLNEPFTVGGERLRFPGDTSLGASAGNVINCRCSSVVSAENAFAVRRKRGELPTVDVALTDPQLELAQEAS